MSYIHDPSSSQNSLEDKGRDSESIVSHIIISKDNSGGIQVSLTSQACASSASVSSAGSVSESSSFFAKDMKDFSASKCSKKKSKKGPKKDNEDVKFRNIIMTEGHIGGENNPISHTVVSPELRAQKCRCEVSSLATASSLPNAMERADISPYTSDEWEEASSNSETEGDHSDSSDDDDPKSQVDRLIEQGTQLYMDGENSALSSEDEDDDDSDYNDSESDITDVSPLISAAASPLGLSPVLSRKIIPTSPLALHNNGEIEFDFFRRSFSQPEMDHNVMSTDTDNRLSMHPMNMDLLLQAVLELENGNLNKSENLNERNDEGTNGRPNHQNAYIEDENDHQSFNVHPIHDNPHHHHLRKVSGSHHKRKNMSFSNEEVRKIDRENKILLKKIMAAHSRGAMNNGHRFDLGNPLAGEFVNSHQRPSTSTLNRSHSSVSRKREEEKIRKENMLLLKKIHEAKPSKEITERRIHSGSTYNPHHHHHHHHHHHNHVSHKGPSNRGLRTTSASCGASMRRMASSPHHVIVSPHPPPHKETAL